MARIAIVNKIKCNPVKCDFLCAKVCPINRSGKDCITRNEKIIIDEKLCNGCGICQHKCPFQAISIINLPQELKTTPIHQYGKNDFRLYRLPTPIFGKVIGIIGKNGIGKSTAVKILAGILKPNLGNLTKEASYEEIIQFFKGTEAQNYFEKLKQGKIIVSYKPQQIDLIPKTVKGKVKDLLKKVDEKAQLEKISKELDIYEILNNNIETLAGGELQRVAIAVTVLKKANLYIFDELTTYLDIKQRLKIAKFIRSLLKEGIAIIVIEHDLIILDYLTDLIHIMYGEESCYGVVSQPKSSKSGINIYLEGYLKEENIRFRDKKIHFYIQHHSIKKSDTQLTSWPKITKKLDSFALDINPGNIAQNEVIGIIGPNSIGKTSFVKILAGILKPDSGNTDKKVIVSYKPQYLESNSEELVSNILKTSKDIILQLNLSSLMNKKLNELSGGELQRVSIALCLSKKADLYLLDEPSAFLDVEQRLSASRVIKNTMELNNTSALVVDHDLLFLDYLSNKLLVFNGIPAKHGISNGPFDMSTGMNSFLSDLKITMRREQENNRPRINKPESQMDTKQKKSGNLYYT